MNRTLLSKIYETMLLQHPPKSLFKAINTLDNLYNEKRVKVRTCLLNNSSCSNQAESNQPNQAIKSHSIPKKNLKYMSTNSKVHASGSDPTNPFKRKLNKSATRSTLTFLGFCSFHDMSLFTMLENDDFSDYNNEIVFLLEYKALAKSFAELRETAERLEWDIKTWHIPERRKVHIEIVKFELEKFKFKQVGNSLLATIRVFLFAIRLFIKTKCIGKIKTISKLKYVRKQLSTEQNKLSDYREIIEKNAAYNSQFAVLKNKKSIAFSLVFSRLIKKQDRFIYITALPTKTGSDLIVSCSSSDYLVIKDDEYISKIFRGDKRSINEILNMFKDKIAHSIEEADVDFGDTFFLEWDFPLGKIEYFEPEGE